ncbi:MAG: DUF4845 domain-containing protein [Methylococcales bacterium]|nr:DUF4845 domain-containing protein [Methylococcales bacterium]
MTLSPKKQQGILMISMVCIGSVIGSIFFLAIAIFPIYIDHNKLTGALKSLKETSEAGGNNETPKQLSERLFKIMSSNYIDNLIGTDNITISKLETGQTRVHIEYEVVKKLVGNASILVEFDDTVDIGR